jgi:hypothetical protein
MTLKGCFGPVFRSPSGTRADPYHDGNTSLVHGPLTLESRSADPPLHELSRHYPAIASRTRSLSQRFAASAAALSDQYM